MDTALTSFSQSINEIKNHIKYIDDLKRDITTSSISYAYSKSIARKKFDYNSLIITLYGIVESHIESFVNSYLEGLESEIKIYNDLNQTVKNNHFSLSIKLVSKIEESRSIKLKSLNKEDVVSNLNNCINSHSGYIFNKEAFTLNSNGNLKHIKISDILKSLGIDLNLEIKSYDGFKINTENLFNKIDDLVQRRNEIAHGTESDILDTSEVTAYVDFIDSYFSAIFKILKTNLNNEKTIYLKKNFGLEIKLEYYGSSVYGILNGLQYELIENNIVIFEKSNGILDSIKIINVRVYPNSQDITIKLERKINLSSYVKVYIINNQSDS